MAHPVSTPSEQTLEYGIFIGLSEGVSDATPHHKWAYNI